MYESLDASKPDTSGAWRLSDIFLYSRACCFAVFIASGYKRSKMHGVVTPWSASLEGPFLYIAGE